VRVVSIFSIAKQNDSVKFADDHELEMDIESIRKNKSQLIAQIRSITAEDQLSLIATMAADLQSVLESIAGKMCQLSETYEEVSRMGELLRKSRVDDAEAQTRISNEMDNLKVLSVRITEELAYIQSEREKLKFREANDFHPLPFPEILRIDDQKVNESWQEMFNRASFGSVYN
jgi:hypothetical protein